MRRRCVFFSAMGAAVALLGVSVLLLRSSRRDVDDLDEMLRRWERWDRFGR